jgi:tripartite-type tricarboxylate transporter receptor subunit TctC
VAKSAADGYTLYQPNSSVLMVNTFLRKNLPFNPAKDFVPVIGLVKTSDVLLVRRSLPVQSVSELVALARSRPGELNFGSFGVGSSPHLDAEQLALAAGIRVMHIPFKGGPDVMKGLLSGDLDFGFTGLTAAIPLIRGGKLKAIAWGADERSGAIPDVPTLKEQGYKFETGGWFAWLAPAGTPQAIVERISSDASAVLATPAFRDKFITAAGLEPLNVQAGPFSNLMKQTQERYRALFKAITIKFD